MRKSTIIAVATIVIVAAIIVVYYTFDPAQYSFFPRCPSKLITGYDCPGCGTQRAFHALLNGNLAEALHHNAILLLAVPFLVVYAAASILKKRLPRFHAAMNSSIVCWTVLGILLLWWVVRNTLEIFQ